MPKEIFDQDRPRSAMARRLDEAFEGCDQWTTAPPPRRAEELAISPWPASPSSLTGGTPSLSAQEPRAA